MGTFAMARPKKKPEGEGVKSATRPTAFAIRGSLEWREWVDGGAHHCRTDVSKLIDAALIEYLTARGYDAPPPKR